MKTLNYYFVGLLVFAIQLRRTDGSRYAKTSHTEMLTSNDKVRLLVIKCAQKLGILGVLQYITVVEMVFAVPRVVRTVSVVRLITQSVLARVVVPQGTHTYAMNKVVHQRARVVFMLTTVVKLRSPVAILRNVVEKIIHVAKREMVRKESAVVKRIWLVAKVMAA